MSSVRVDSPLLSEFRRQPSPCAPTMPKPRACRKLFPVDHAETNRLLQTKFAEMDAEQQARIGIDLERYVPLEDQSSSRYTGWEAMPADSVPSFYRETFAKTKSKPVSRLRQPAERGSNSTRQNKNDSRSHTSLSCTNDAVGTPLFLRTHSTVTSDRSFEPLRRYEALDSSTQNSAAVTASIKTDELETSVSEPNTTCKNQKRGTESVRKGVPCTSTSVVDKQLVDKQSKVTDYFRQRKRGGSEISKLLPDTVDGDKHEVPTKRRMGTNNPVDGGNTLPEVGQS